MEEDLFSQPEAVDEPAMGVPLSEYRYQVVDANGLIAETDDLLTAESYWNEASRNRDPYAGVSDLVLLDEGVDVTQSVIYEDPTGAWDAYYGFLDSVE